jgi:hypothetical protein
MNDLKTIFLIGLMVIASPSQADESTTAHETKLVCHDALGKDNKPIKDKTGKVKQNCKKVKIHKKFEGTKVPDKKAKK